jgi:uncharacterized SAM-binding protein YcdF (DUF218 family)
MLYALKKIAAALAGPMTLALLLLVVAGCLRAAKFRRSSLWLALFAGAIAYLGAIAPVGSALLGELKHQYPPLPAALPAVRYIVVLGSGYDPRDGIPVTGALDADGLARVVEGVRLAKRIESSRLVVSGGAPVGSTPPAIGYAELARQLGIAPESIVVLDRPLDTAAEAREIHALLGTAPFLLVTSAYHMPRAMRLVQGTGARPIAAPTGQRVRQNAPAQWGGLLPSAAGLAKTERALHEFMGIAAAAVGLEQITRTP